MINLAISGAQGRMGQAIIKLAKQDESVKISALLEQKDHPKVTEKVEDLPVSTNNSVIEGTDVLIEFTLPEGTIENLKACVHHRVKMVIGTTGLSPSQIDEIKTASESIPIVYSSNMSIGVNVLFKLIEISASKLGKSDMNIEETHHVHKKDKPSGTAKTMGGIAEHASGQNVNPIKSIRAGEVVGDHSIVFDTAEDVLTISHHAKDRSMFAKGALTAAKFLMDKETGLYNMQDVLDLE